MTARAANGSVPESKWSYKVATLKSGQRAYQGSVLFLEASSNKLTRTVTGNTAWAIAAEPVDATSADKEINVKFPNELTVLYFVNGSSIAATDIGKPAYFVDDQTVSLLAGGPIAGKVIDVDSAKGVGIVPSFGGMGNVAGSGATLTFTAGDTAPTDIQSGAIYDVPTTAANSTITLPAAAADGTIAYFTADGTKNGHTITYRDATGPVALTTALTASKRHLVTVTKAGGKWFAAPYVSP